MPSTAKIQGTVIVQDQIQIIHKRIGLNKPLHFDYFQKINQQIYPILVDIVAHLYTDYDMHRVCC